MITNCREECDICSQTNKWEYKLRRFYKKLESHQTAAIVYHCNRCYYNWFPKKHGVIPMECPSCNSPYWKTKRSRPVPVSYQETELD